MTGSAPAPAASAASSLRTRLELGRVSNLPTVWSGALAAALLSEVPLSAAPTLAVVLALSLYYVAGMYLNDACDADIDAIERPTRPIPSGRASVADVRLEAALMFVLGTALLAAARIAAPGAAGSGSAAWVPATALLIGAIVAYDRAHKDVPHAPLVMGACRLLVYAVTACTLAGALPAAALGGGALVFAWVVGLTLVARGEKNGPIVSPLPLALLALPLLVGAHAAASEPLVLLPLVPLAGTLVLAARRFRRGRGEDTGRAVGLMIAGICLVDATLVARNGESGWVVAMLGAFALALWLQGRVAAN